MLDGVAPKILSDASSIDTVNKELESFEKTNPIETEKVKSTLCAAIEYLSQFRADNIVRDAEYIKDALLLSLDEEEAEKVSLKISKCKTKLGSMLLTEILRIIANTSPLGGIYRTVIWR